ncbi:cilia- and flagella-associated protein 54 isoform X2 [Esox lucius]|uniref:cilia- and flagella-associated protein 54 isoform X2 n=1 Tax=Esox lucius TaxID=8010 RepID=UPI00147735BE|nr:cilia- and flagella-associated protein 54 isoform X2 [Esox lucius]
MNPLQASFYGKIDQRNPVISAFDGDIKEFMSFMKRISNLPTYDHNSYARGAKTLFKIWNEYKPRLPTSYYEEHMLQVADFLFDVKLYRLALWQGYSRYLQQFRTVNIEEIRDVDHFQMTFFPKGFDTDQARLTFRALQGVCLCAFQLEREKVSHPTQEGIQELLNILGFVRILMQAVLPHEHLCWVLYNGSLCIYNICRYLMSMSYTSQAMEFLLWACICLETSIPLMTAKFLAWRVTLYCAVCQCHYDSQANVQAEAFARRALCKVSELGKLEEMSGLAATTETQRTYKEATVKLAAMVFKRSVYEHRRKPKGLLRPKQKSNLKEIHNMQWPRTPTERALMEMFEGNSARFLAIVEALWDSSRRLLQTGMPEESEIQEVCLELMTAGISILSGIGGSTEPTRDDSLPTCLNAVTGNFTLIEMAAAGESKVSVDAAVKFVKLLFHYEQWEMFCILSDAMKHSVLPKMEGQSYRKSKLELCMLDSMERFLSAQRNKFHSKEDTVSEKDRQLGGVMSEEFVSLVQTLHTCVCDSAQDVLPDRDLVMDIVLNLWSKCKTVFQRAQVRHWDPVRFLNKMENQEKWVWTLSVLSEVSHVCGLADSDPMVFAEMTIRLAMVLESTADSTFRSGRNTASSEDNSVASMPAEKNTYNFSNKSPSGQLQSVWEVVERGLKGLISSWTRLMPCDGSAISDTVFMQKFAHHSTPEGKDNKPVNSPSLSLSLSPAPMDLYVELLFVQHRVSLKLIYTCPAEIKQHAGDSRSSLRPPVCVEAQSEAMDNKAKGESALLERIKKNKISKALFLVQKALLCQRKDQKSSTIKRLLEEAVVLIEKAEVEEKRLFSTSGPSERKKGAVEEERKTRPPPAPVLLSRTNNSMTFTSAPYALEDQVCWYHIYGREAEGLNLKVRLGDNNLVGTGDKVPASGKRLLQVEGLEPNQKYVFAVAAYDTQGKLVGGAIGETTRPLLASVPLPLLTTWAHLAQAAYQTGQHAVAKRACSELWSHFTLPKDLQEPGAAAEGLAQTRLRLETLQRSSPLLLHLFLSSILMQTEIHIQEGMLFCDTLCDRGPPIGGQEARLAECERMLVAIDLSLWLNDSSAALQAVVGCYGLLAPLMFHQIPVEPVVQVLIKCLMVLTEISGVVKQKRSAATTESLLHMIACITYFVAKVLRTMEKHRMAAEVIDQGKILLHDVLETMQGFSKPLVVEPDGVPRKAGTIHGEEEQNEQMMALEGSVMKNNKTGTFAQHDSSAWSRAMNHGHELTGHEDPILLYTIVTNSPLKAAFKDLMKFKRKSCFMEFSVLLLQRTMQEEQLELVVQWGHDIFSWLCRRDEGLTSPKKDLWESPMLGKDQKFSLSVVDKKKNKASTCQTDKKNKEFLQRKQLTALKAQNTRRECKAVEIMLNQLAPLVRRHQHRRHLRQLCSEEGLWKCHLNLSVARAHLGLLRRSLEHHQGFGALQHNYSQLPPSMFSLAHSGTLVRWRNMPQQIRDPELTNMPNKTSPQPCLRSYVKAVIGKGKESGSAATTTSGEDSCTTESSEQGSEPNSPRTQASVDPDCSEPSVAASSLTRHFATQLLDSINKAALHLRRAMVLAHRGGHWTTLQCVCRSLWDQGYTIALLVERGASMEPPIPLTLDQFYSFLAPLFELATDLLMDMMERLQLWQLFEKVEEHEMEASMHFSPPFDDCTLVDLRWIRSLILHTLELLYLKARWENLAHLSLLLNSHTRERYTHIITPLLVHAQRRLLERISSFGGPPVPQPHHIETQKVTGQKITCKNYAGTQLLIGWTPLAVPSPRQGNNAPSNRNTERLELSEVRRAMCLVCVPLDVEDTLCCFRETLENGSHTVQNFRHSRTLLLLLLAHTQPLYKVPFCRESKSRAQGHGRVDFNLTACKAPAIGPPDLSSEDFSTLSSIYGCPLPPNQIHTVINSYSNTIQYLEANNHNSLRVQALHDLGNLHYYNGNRRAAHSYWSKAVDCALQSSGILDSWDGVLWATDSPQHRNILQQAGVWGCLQGAIMTAKIAQFAFTTNISQRTKFSLLSAQLFKCLLQASLPHPQSDLQYSSYTVGEELIPGLDLFSEPDRGPLGTTVSSLAFLCHWLYTSGHHITALPILALYLHFVGTLCRDPRLTIKGRILKVKVLTELGLYNQAMKEMARVTQAQEIPLADGCYSNIEKHVTIRKFHLNKPIMDSANIQALEDLVNLHLSSEASDLYGPRLSRHLTLARVQLILAFSSTIHSMPEPLGQDISDGTVCTSFVSKTSSNPNSPPGGRDHDSEKSHSGSPSMKNKEAKGAQFDLQTDKLTLSKLKAFLLRDACHLLNLQQQLCSSQPHFDPEEMELAVDTYLLLSSLYLQQGKTAQSADTAVSAMTLLQNSPVTQSGSPSPAHRPLTSSIRRQSMPKSEQGGVWEAEHSAPCPQTGDSPQAVEARERMDRALWLRCRLAVVRSLVAHIPATAIYPGVDSSVEAARLLKEGLQEAEAWGDPDTKALFLLQGAKLDTHRGRPREDSISLLQEAVSLLSGRSCLSPRSSITLAQATLLLSDLRGPGSQVLHLLTQKLLKQQLCVLGENVSSGEGGIVTLPPDPGLSNIYLPQLPLLAKATMRLGHCLAVQAMTSAHSSGPSSPSNQSTPSSKSNLATISSSSSPSPYSQPWVCALEVLQSALLLCQACAARDRQLEADILYCKGMVERCLMCLGDFQPQTVTETLLDSINISVSHSHNSHLSICVRVRLIRKCYLEMALVYLYQWEQSSTAKQEHQNPILPSPPKNAIQKPSLKSLRTSLNRGLTTRETYLLLYWVSVRAAKKACEAMFSFSQLCGTTRAKEGNLPLDSLRALPDFATNDLLNPCGGLGMMARTTSTPENDPEQSRRKHNQLTWVHLSRYFTHLFNLQRMATRQVVPQCVEGLVSQSVDSSLALRLVQLQNFFCSHLAGYSESCSAPEPPTELIMQPQILQMCPTVRGTMGVQLCPWSFADKKQLCIHWHRPALSHKRENTDTILLLFTLNSMPLSAMKATASAVVELQCGQKAVSMERLGLVHAQLVSACVGANISCPLADSVTPTPSPKMEKQRRSKTPDKTVALSPHVQMLQEKTRRCFAAIKDLLQAGSETVTHTEVPFEASLQTLCDLERCFNPASGAIVEENLLITWLISLLA